MKKYALVNILRFVRASEEFPVLPGKFCIHMIKWRTTDTFRVGTGKLLWMLQSHLCICINLTASDGQHGHYWFHCQVVYCLYQLWLLVTTTDTYSGQLSKRGLTRRKRRRGPGTPSRDQGTSFGGGGGRSRELRGWRCRERKHGISLQWWRSGWRAITVVQGRTHHPLSVLASLAEGSKSCGRVSAWSSLDHRSAPGIGVHYSR